MTDDEAQAAYDAAPAIPMSEEKIDEIVAHVKAKMAQRHADRIATKILYPDGYHEREEA